MAHVNIHSIDLKSFKDAEDIINNFNIYVLLKMNNTIRLNFNIILDTDSVIFNKIKFNHYSHVDTFLDYCKLVFNHNEFYIKLFKLKEEPVSRYWPYFINREMVTQNKINTLNKIFKKLDKFKTINKKSKILDTNNLDSDEIKNKLLEFYAMHNSWNMQFNHIIIGVRIKKDGASICVFIPGLSIVLNNLTDDLITYLINSNFDNRYNRSRVSALKNF